MTEIGRVDSVVRGITVFAAYIVGVAVMTVRSDFAILSGTVLVFVLATIAANYVDRDVTP